MDFLSAENISFRKEGEAVTASGRIPETAEFFQDHFPGFPVLPGVLALEILKRTAEAHGTQQRRRLKKVAQVKFSSYLKPGDEWESQVTLVKQGNGESEFSARLFSRGRNAVSAHFTLGPVRVAGGICKEDVINGR